MNESRESAGRNLPFAPGLHVVLYLDQLKDQPFSQLWIERVAIAACLRAVDCFAGTIQFSQSLSEISVQDGFRMAIP